MAIYRLIFLQRPRVIIASSLCHSNDAVAFREKVYEEFCERPMTAEEGEALTAPYRRRHGMERMFI